MRLHLGSWILVAATLCPAQTCIKPRVPSGGLPVSVEMVPIVYTDGYQTIGNLWRPDGPPPPCGWPLVVHVHRLAENRFADVGMQQWLAGQGYAVWSYDVRGQGQAWQLNVGHPNAGTTVWGEQERFDLAEQILAVAARPAWQGMVDGTRVAVVGSSQGGVHAWNAAAWSGRSLTVPGRGSLLFPSIACAVANDYVAEPVQDWLRGGLLWSTWFVNLISDDLVPPFELSPVFRNAAAAAFRAQDPQGLVQQWSMENRPIAALLTATSVPVLYSHAYHDLIDSPLPTLQLLQGIPAPTRVLLSTIGHNTPDNVHERVFRDALILRWLDRWLWQENNEVEIEADDRFVMSAVPLARSQREDANFAWTRVHRSDPLVSTNPTRFWLDDQGAGPVLSTTAPAGALAPAVVQQVIQDPNFTAANYLALAANRALPEVLLDCPLSEQVFATTLAAAAQIDAAAHVHLTLVPDAAQWQLAALLTLQEPGGDEVLLSSWGVASRSSQAGVAENVDFPLPPVATVAAAGTTVRLRLRNLWLREFPMARELEAAPLFTPFRLDIARGAGPGSWIELPLVTPAPALVVESGVDVPVGTLPPVHLRVRGGQAYAGRPYFMSASLGGHLPRMQFQNGSLPLEPDWLYGVIVGAVGLPQFAGFLGDLHPVSGESTAIMDLSAAAPLDPMFVGMRLSFAAWVFDDLAGASGTATNPIDLFLR